MFDVLVDKIYPILREIEATEQFDVQQDLIHALNVSLELHGCTLLGEGSYGVVYTNPDNPNTVFKIGGHLTQDAYLPFIHWVVKNPHAHLPTVHNLHSNISSDTYIAEIDRLEDINDFYGITKVTWSDSDTEYFDYMDKMRQTSFYRLYQAADAVMAGSFEDVPRYLVDDEVYNSQVVGVLHVTLRIKETLVEQDGWREDLHDGNVMVNPRTGNLIITDPIS